MVRPVAALLFSLLVAGRSPVAVSAHPLHTSFTEVVRDRTTGVVSISVRLFADDFGNTIDSLSRLPSARGISSDGVVQAYFERSVVVARDGKPVRLAWCGMRNADGLTWLCARSVGAVPAGKLRIRNALMFDRFADQISIVRWTTTSGARTIVLTGRSPEAALD